MPTRVETLDNGLKVILRPIPDTQALSTWVVYRIGSRNELPGMTGSTHWVEHMLFKGGGKLAKGDIDKMISRLGGKMNAFTDTDYTMYFETIPASAMDTALMIESERMRNAAFDPKEVEAERTVVISEREGAENQPEFAVEEELWGLAFHVHPYHWTAIGYKQDLATLDREPLYRHYLRYYAPNNASLVLVGGFDPAVAMQRVREAFGALKPETPPDPLRLSEPEQHGERRSDLDRPGPADLLSVGWHIPAASHEDTAALVLLSTVLGGWRGIVPFAAGDWQPRSNRLYRALVGRRAGAVVLKYASEQLVTLLREHLDEVVASRRLSPAVPPEVTVQYLASALLGTLTWWLDNDMPYPAEQMGRMFLRLAKPAVAAALDASM